MSAYHHQVKVELGCGCALEFREELPDGVDPSGRTSIIVLLHTIMEDTVLDFCTDDMHVERGQEKVDISIRTKVGPIPAEMRGWTTP